jgi:hypothetical protein
VQHFFLVIDGQIFENLRGNVVGQDAQENGFVIGLQVEKNLSDVGGGKVAENGAKLSEVAFRDQFHEFGLQQIANHAPNQTQVSRSSKTKVWASGGYWGVWAGQTLQPVQLKARPVQPFRYHQKKHGTGTPGELTGGVVRNRAAIHVFGGKKLFSLGVELAIQIHPALR